VKVEIIKPMKRSIKFSDERTDEILSFKKPWFYREPEKPQEVVINNKDSQKAFIEMMV
jgi:hypothetical protein